VLLTVTSSVHGWLVWIRRIADGGWVGQVVNVTAVLCSVMLI